MSNSNRVIALATLALCAWWSLSATAQTYTATFIGVIDTSAADTAGYFGGGNLEGDAITTTYTYSLTNGADYSVMPGVIAVVQGGLFNNSPDPNLSISVTVNGITDVFIGGYQGTLDICPGCPEQVTATDIAFSTSAIDDIQNAIVSGDSLGLATDLTASQASANVPTSLDFSNFVWGSDSFYFTDTSVVFNAAPDQQLPEPSSIAAFGSGLLVLCMLLRRRA